MYTKHVADDLLMNLKTKGISKYIFVQPKRQRFSIYAFVWDNGAIGVWNSLSFGKLTFNVTNFLNIYFDSAQFLFGIVSQ